MVDNNEVHKFYERLKKWNYYKEIMHKNKCDDWVIDVCNNIIFLSERSMAIDEYMRITKNDSISFDINNM